MTQDAIFSPFFATVFLALLVWVYMYTRRIHFITSRKLRRKTSLHLANWHRFCHRGVSIPSDNFKNLFEIPVLFYALVLYLFITKQVDTVYVNAASSLCFAHCIALSIAYSISSSFGFTCTYLARLRCGSLRSAQPLSTSVPRKAFWLCPLSPLSKYRCEKMEFPQWQTTLSLPQPRVSALYLQP